MFKFLKRKKKEKVASSQRKIKDLKISVIMPVYLGDYKGAATDREEKFKRAVISFVQQKYKNKELIIVSDGCDIAENTYNNFLKYDNIVFKKIDKQPLFSGNVRAEGILKASGDVICYLDSDDMLGENHLQTVVGGFNNPKTDYIYYNDLILAPNKQPVPRSVELEHGSVGTSSFAHRNDVLFGTWNNCDGYGHDWTFINRIIVANKFGYKINGAEYYVCHIPNVF